jgi:hypothetical protein
VATAIEVPGTAALNAGGMAEMDAVSCHRAGNCTGGGTYYDESNARLVRERGKLRRDRRVPDVRRAPDKVAVGQGRGGSGHEHPSVMTP